MQQILISCHSTLLSVLNPALTSAAMFPVDPTFKSYWLYNNNNIINTNNNGFCIRLIWTCSSYHVYIKHKFKILLFLHKVRLSRPQSAIEKHALYEIKYSSIEMVHLYIWFKLLPLCENERCEFNRREQRGLFILRYILHIKAIKQRDTCIFYKLIFIIHAQNSS